MDIKHKQIHTLKSWLFTPATKADHFGRAAEVEADAVIIDLEDAVALGLVINLQSCPSLFSFSHWIRPEEIHRGRAVQRHQSTEEYAVSR